jgi:type 1 fimbria pilin
MGLAATGGEFSVVSPATPFTIVPGGAPVDVTLRFSPSAVGVQNGTLDITSDDPDEGLVSVPLTGNGVATPEPDITVSLLSLDYGDVVQGTSSDQIVTISNVGSADLTVTGLAISGGEFLLVSPPATPFTIVPGGTPVDVTVRFSPSAVGVQNGTLDITSDDPDEGLVIVPLTGNGVTTPPGVEYRINAAGPDYTDSNGDLFEADRAYVPGDLGYAGSSKPLNVPNPVSGTVNDALYQDLRKSVSGATFSYVFDNIPSDSYDITFYFMYPAPKPSVMDIHVEGVLEVDDLSVLATAGRYVAYIENITVDVTDGQLNIDFVPVSGSGSHISAIAVVSSTQPTPTPDISISPANIDYGSIVQGTSSDQVVSVWYG